MTNFIKPVFFLIVGGALYFSSSFLGEPEGGVIEYSAGNSTMNEAQDDAQRSLPEFLAHKLDENGVGAEGAMVKVAFPVPSDEEGGVEVIWVGPFARSGDAFTGALANDPVSIGGAFGDQVAFTQDMIRDWMYQGADGKLYGNYTTRVMLSDMTATQAAQISQILSADPLPQRW